MFKQFFLFEKQVIATPLTKFVIGRVVCKNKKALPINHQKSYMKKINIQQEAIHLTYLPRFHGWSWHLTSYCSHETGCQGVIGPFPSAFLDKRC